MDSLTGLQPDYRGSSSRKPHAFGAAALLCLALLAMLALVQVTHTHALESDPDHCSLCIAMHSATPVAIIAVLVVLIRMGRPEPLVEARSVVRHWHPKLYTRPPPAGC
jgi:hypothetical protein